MSKATVQNQSSITREAVIKLDAAVDSISDIRKGLARLADSQKAVENCERTLDRIRDVTCPSDDINEELFIMLADFKADRAKTEQGKEALIHRLEWVRNSLDDTLRSLRG